MCGDLTSFDGTMKTAVACIVISSFPYDDDDPDDESDDDNENGTQPPSLI